VLRWASDGQGWIGEKGLTGGEKSGDDALVVDGDDALVVLKILGGVDEVGKALARWRAWSAT
jgi:hypothetical protein